MLRSLADFGNGWVIYLRSFVSIFHVLYKYVSKNLYGFDQRKLLVQDP